MNRIEKVQRKLSEWSVDILVVENPIDIFYLTQQQISAGRLIVEENSSSLYVDGRYFEACKKEASIPVFLEKEKYPSFSNKRVGFDANATTFDKYEKLSASGGECIALKSPMHMIRAIKEESEISLLRSAAKLGFEGLNFAISQIRTGIEEKELSAELEIFWKKNGSDRLAFLPIIAFGINTAYPHHHSGKNKLTNDGAVLLDIGVVKDHYNSDLTRVVFRETYDKKLEEIYSVVKEAQKRALAICKPGTPISEVDRAARGYIEMAGYGQFFTHNLGHGVGLEIHEEPKMSPKSDEKLQQGMVVTIEPGVYLPGIGGVRLEDTIVITSNGNEILR